MWYQFHYLKENYGQIVLKLPALVDYWQNTTNEKNKKIIIIKNHTTTYNERTNRLKLE